jgi:hypothetical protein
MYLTANRRRNILYAEAAKPTQARPSILLPQQLLLELTRAICQQLAELTDRAVFLCSFGFKYRPYQFQLNFTEARNIYTTGIYFCLLSFNNKQNTAQYTVMKYISR